jgi:hypothetical protein
MQHFRETSSAQFTIPDHSETENFVELLATKPQLRCL